MAWEKETFEKEDRLWLIAFLKRCIESDKFPIEKVVTPFVTLMGSPLDTTDRFETVKRICKIVGQLEETET
jgi:hypothetical protein